MDIDFTKCLAQEKAWNALLPGNTICIPWGRGIGKSYWARLVCYLLVCQWDGKTREDTDEKGIRIVILMPTLVQARKVHSQLLISEIEGRWKFLGGTLNKTDWRVSFPGGSWIQFVSAEVADSSRGIRCDVVFADEADDIDPEVVDSITQPWFSEPRSLRIFVIGGTPRRGRYGLLYKAAKQWTSADWWLNSQGDAGITLAEAEELASRHFSFHATAYDAPKLVDPRYLAQVKRKTAPTVFQREWMCDFDSAEGLVFPMFGKDSHVFAPTVNNYHTHLVGIDHGFEDPAVFVVIGVTGSGRDSVAHVLWEYCEQHKTIEELCDVARMINASYPNAKWYADSSGAEKIESYQRVIKKQIMHATHKIEQGIDTMSNMLFLRPTSIGTRQPHLIISPKCRNLIEELGKYRRKRDPKNTELILEDIEDKWNHSIDATRYPCFHYFHNIYSTKSIIHDHSNHDVVVGEYEFQSEEYTTPQYM